jgi:cytochrome c2
MQALVSSIIGMIFLIIGFLAAWIMLSLKGKAKDHIHRDRLVLVHRILGYAFFGILAFMLLVMIIRISHYQGELQPRLIIHMSLALALVPLVGFKILIVRRYPLFTSRLLFFGVTIFTLAFLFNMITAGHYFLYSSDVGYVSISRLDTEVMDESIGRQFVVSKCSKCHTLERVFRSFKSEQGWTDTVNRMALIDRPNIRDYDAKQIIFFLMSQQEMRGASGVPGAAAAIGTGILQNKCTLCHDLERVYKAEKDASAWIVTLDRMIQHSGNPDYLTDLEKADLTDYLVSRKQN